MSPFYNIEVHNNDYKRVTSRATVPEATWAAVQVINSYAVESCENDQCNEKGTDNAD